MLKDNFPVRACLRFTCKLLVNTLATAVHGRVGRGVVAVKAVRF